MCSCSADKCLIANSFSCFKPEANLCAVFAAQLVSSPTAPMMIDLKHQCIAIWTSHIVSLHGCSKPLQNYAELFFDQRCSKLPAFEEARRQMDQAVVRQWQALHLSEFAESLWVHGSDVLRSEVHLKLVRSASIYVRKMHYPYEIRCTNEYNLMWLIPIQTYSNNI